MGRRYVQKVSLGMPDSEHLHSLIKTRVIRPNFGYLPLYLRNSLVAPFCWLYAALVAGVAVWQYRSTDMLFAAWLISFLLYVFLYTYLKRTTISLPQENQQLFQ